MGYPIQNIEREAVVTELLESRHPAGNLLELAIFMAQALLRNGESAHRAITAAERFLKRQGV